MRSFALEMESLAGWYDGQAINVVHDAADDEMVRHHESQHANICLHTIDGQLLSFCIKEVEQKERVRFPRRSRALIRAHIAVARRAHECSATFIGIEMLMDAKDRETSRKTLPFAYQEYYDVFDRMISPMAKSSYLRCAVAQAFTHFVFSSHAFKTFVDRGFDYTALLLDPPDLRLGRFEEWWTEAGATLAAESIANRFVLEPAMREFSAGLSPRTPFGALDDDAVITRNADFATMVDGLVIGTIYSFLIENSPLRSISRGSEEWAAIVERIPPLPRPFAEDDDVARPDLPSAARGLPDTRDSDIARLHAAVVLWKRPYDAAIADLQVMPTAIENVRKVIEDPGLLFNVLFDQRGMLAGDCLIEICQPNGMPTRSVDGTAMDVKRLYSLDPQLTLQLILNHMYWMYCGLPHSSVGVIVMPHENPDDGANYALLKRLTYVNPALPKVRNGEFDYDDLGPVQVLGDACVEYLTGSMHEFSQAHRGSSRFGAEAVRIQGHPDVMACWAERSDQVPKHVVKILPFRYGIPIGLFWEREARHDRIRLAGSNMPPAVETATRLVMNHWTVI